MTAAPPALPLRQGFRALWNWLFPPACACCGSPLPPVAEEFLCSHCRAEFRVAVPFPCGRCNPFGGADPAILCERCKHLPASFDSLRSAFPYPGAAGQIIRNLKYRHGSELAAPLAQLLVTALSDHLLALLKDRAIDVLVPIPMTPLRRWWRGYNQAEVLAEELGRLLSLAVGDGLLLRGGWRTPQARLADPKLRLENVEGSFFVPDPLAVQGYRFLLVDDVTTTGATLACAAKALKDAGALEVHALTVAVAGDGLRSAPAPSGLTGRDATPSVAA